MSTGIIIKIGAQTADAISGINKVNKALGDQMTGMEKFKSGVNKAFVPAVAALAGLGAAAYGAAQKAGDLAETQSKVGVIFGDAAKDLQAWSKAAPKALGQTQQAALDAASTMATFGKAAGLTGKDLTKFSTSLVDLGSDLASFYNTDPAEATAALGAALRGETEPIRKYGVMLNDAAIQAEALALGLVKAEGDTLKIQTATLAASRAQEAYSKALKKYGPDSAQAADKAAALEIAQQRVGKAMEGQVPKLEASQKALAVQSLVMKQTADAQGDFARTSDGAANQQRILAATVEQFQTDLGAVFLPILQAVTGALAGVAEWAGKNQTLFLVLAGVVATLAAAVVAAKVAMMTWAAVQQILAAKTAIVTAAQWLWNAALTANPIGIVIVAIAAFVAAIVLLWHKCEGFRKVVTAVWEGILTAVKATVDWFVNTAWPWVKQFVDNHIKAFQQLWDFIKTAWDAIYKVVEPVVRFFFDIGQNIVNALKDGISKAWGGLTGFVSDKVGGLVDGVKGIFGIASPSRVFIGIGGDIVKGFEIGLRGLDKVNKKVAGKMRDLVAAANDAIAAELDARQGALKEATDKYATAFDSVANSIRSAFDMGAVIEEMGKDGGNWQEVWNQQVAKAKWMADVVRTLVAQGASEGLIAMVQSQGAAGAAWGEAIIKDGLVPQMSADLAQVDVWAGEAGAAFADTFYLPGVSAATTMLNGINTYIDGQMDALVAKGRQMGLAIEAGFNATRPKAVAAGGFGPKALPLGDQARAFGGATLAPNHHGSGVNITVQAGVGDPVAIAKEIRRVLDKGSLRTGVAL